VTPRAPSIRARLLVLLLGGMVVVWAGAALLTWRDAAHELDELLDAHLAQTAALLLARQEHLGHDDDDERPLRAQSLHRYAPRVAVQVFHDARLVLRTPNADREPLASPRASGFSDVAREGIGWRVFVARGDDGIAVLVGEQTASRTDILRAVLRGVLWPLVLALPLLGLATWWGVRRGLAPLQRLRDVLAARAPGDTGPVSLPGAPAELGPPLAALDDLLSRIEGLLAAERRFTADAAHELRTPIAALRAQAEAALGARDEAERATALSAVREGTDRAARLVDQLLTLARLEAGASLSLAPLDVAVIARGLLADLAPAALARGQDLTFDDHGAPALHGDETLLGLLLRNLVDNAIRHAPPGAPIRVVLQTRGGDGELRIADGGPGLDEAQRARLGERFFRAEARGDGSGLGWSIVRRCAAAMGASLRVGRSAELGGLDVALCWPAAR
jgi:two-component system sensor histidine kinase QseC